RRSTIWTPCASIWRRPGWRWLTKPRPRKAGAWLARSPSEARDDGPVFFRRRLVARTVAARAADAGDHGGAGAGRRRLAGRGAAAERLAGGSGARPRRRRAATGADPDRCGPAGRATDRGGRSSGAGRLHRDDGGGAADAGHVRGRATGL